VYTRQLEYLAALDRERHFARAAEVCHVTQSTLSAGIRVLEAGLGVPLVRRGRRFEGFTPEGERVLIWAHRIRADCEHLTTDVARLRGEMVGVLRIGAIPTTLAAIALITSPFLERHPLMRIEARSLTSRGIERALHTYELDIGLTYLDNEPLDGMRTWPIYHERYLFLTPHDSPFAGRETVSWRDIGDVPLCLLNPEMQNRRIIDGLFRQAGVMPPVPAVETDTLATLLSYVRSGRSSIIAHPWLATFGVPESMRALPLVEPAATQVIGLICPDQHPLPPLVTELTEITAALDVDAHFDRDWSTQAA
jgi:DNA-binding transcriptional LysR family regulator